MTRQMVRGAISYLEDEPHASGDAGVMGLGVQNEALATFSATALDYVPAAHTKSGQALIAALKAESAGDTSSGVARMYDPQGNAVLLGIGPYKYIGANNWDRERTPNVFKVVALAAATAETTIWTPTSGKKFRLMGFILTCGAASTLTFKDNTTGTTIFAARGATDTPISPAAMGNGILSAAANNVLTVTRGTSCTLDGVVWGTEE